MMALKGGSSARTRMHRSMLKTYAAAALSVSLLSSPALADNWPAWRGAEGSGICRETNLPLRWSTNENVRWRVALADRGNSTPIVWKEQIFITQAIENRRTVICRDLPEATHWRVALAGRTNLDRAGTDASG